MNRYDGTVINAIGEAMPAAQVFVCNQPASTGSIPPSPLATLYTDSTGNTVLPNPVIVDGNGNFFFYAPVGVYTIVYFDPYNRFPVQVFPDQQIVTPGGGSVNSVGLTVPQGFSASGSPVTSSGNLGLGFSADWPVNSFLAGPATGSPGLPTRRQITLADLVAAGAGTVSSVSASVTPGALFNALFTGGPITSSGVLNLAFDFNPQAANTILAGPASGGLGAVTARAQVPADLPPGVVVPFSATPVFNGGTNIAFIMTLTGNVTSSTFGGGAVGQIYTFEIKQDSAGNRTFAWPANVKGNGAIDPTPNITNVQSFMWDGTNLVPVGPMQSF